MIRLTIALIMTPPVQCITSWVTCPTRPRHPQARIRATRGAHSSPSPRVAISYTPLTNRSGTAPCATKNPITPQHPKVTARTKHLARPGSWLPDGFMLRGPTERLHSSIVTYEVTLFTPGGGTRTESASDHLMVR